MLDCRLVATSSYCSSFLLKYILYNFEIFHLSFIFLGHNVFVIIFVRLLIVLKHSAVENMSMCMSQFFFNRMRLKIFTNASDGCLVT